LSRRITEYRETPETRGIVEREQAELQSRVFYKQIGYPEYGGKYAPIVVPEGSRVARIEEKTITAQGPLRDGDKAKTTTTLEVSLEEKTVTPMKSVSEHIMDTSKPTMEQVAVGVKTDPMFLFKQQEKTTAKEFVAGAVASVEHTLYSGVKTASLIADFYQVPDIVRGSIKVASDYGPQPPPTVSSGLIGKGVGLVTGQESTDLEKATRSPAYAVGSILGDVLQSITLSETIKGIRGSNVKVKRLVGAKEQEFTKGTGKTLDRNRLTEYLTETKTVSKAEAKNLKEFQRLTTPTKIGLAGEQVRIEKYGGLDAIIRHKSAEVWRKPSPILETISASKKQGLVRTALDKLHLSRGSGDKVVAVSSKTFSEKGTVFSYKHIGITTKAGKSFVQSTDEIIAIGTKAGSKNLPMVFPKGMAFADKTFSGVLIEGTIDTQAYLKLTKAVGPAFAQKWYPQMGGVSASILQKTLPATVTVTTKIVGLQLASNVAGVLGGITGVVAPKLTSQFSSVIGAGTKMYTSLIPLSILSRVVNEKQDPSIIIPFSKLPSRSLVSDPSFSITPKQTFPIPQVFVDQPQDQFVSPVISPKGSTYLDVDLDMRTGIKQAVDPITPETVVSGGGSFIPMLGTVPARFIPEVGASFGLRKSNSKRKRIGFSGKQKRMYPIKTAEQFLKEFT